MSLTQAEIDLLRRSNGEAPNGVVHIEDFDQGVVETLGAVIEVGPDGKDNYYLTGEGIIDPPFVGIKIPPGLPGVPINFSYPEDLTDDFEMPAIVIVPGDIVPDMGRWNPGTLQYRAPAIGSVPVVGTHGSVVTGGFSHITEKQQAMPYTLDYTIILYDYRRHTLAPLLQYVLSIYNPYTRVYVKDSVGDRRIYSATCDSVIINDDVYDMTHRKLGYSIRLRIDGELDVLQPRTYTSVLRMRQLRMTVR